MFERLDRYGMTDPDNNEGHPEDRCNVCDRPIGVHPCWAHRWYALLDLIARRWP